MLKTSSSIVTHRTQKAPKDSTKAELGGVHRDKRGPHGACVGLLWLLALCFWETPKSGREGVSDPLACPWDPCSPTCYLAQPLYEGLYLVLLHLVMLCLADIPGTPALF